MHSTTAAAPPSAIASPARRARSPLDLPASAEATPLPETTVLRNGREYLEIRDIDRIPPFLMSIVSDSDLWFYASSNGGLTAGRVDPDHAVFPYRTADRILDQPDSAGIFSQIRCGDVIWQPWAPGTPAAGIRRNLYKHVTGTSVIFEEIHTGLDLAAEWELWASERFGLVRRCRLRHTGTGRRRVSLLDGWHHLLPSGVSQETYARYSYLAAAYMRHESVPGRRMGIYTLNSGITDRAEPSESLLAATAWSIGLDEADILLSTRQVDAWRRCQKVNAEHEVRGAFGAHLLVADISLDPMETREWFVVADTLLDHAALIHLRNRLKDPAALAHELAADLEVSAAALTRRIAGAGALQQTADSGACIHHFANVLFNCMRGGTLHDNHRFPRADFDAFLKQRNTAVRERHAEWLGRLPDPCSLEELAAAAAEIPDIHLRRLAGEYLPLCFSRRHGDPSRPWNRFEIRTKDADGNPVFAYAGNWRDIFQNWESLAYSYPACFGPMIDIFLNASTADGYNPYRITRAGIDWEVLDPSDPWSHIGYWGDHQIIYLLRLLEGDARFHPGRLRVGLNERRHCHADVPYRIKGFDELLHDPKHSIRFDDELHQQLIASSAALGGDGKLLAGADGEILLVTLAEKLLLPLLVKLGNLVPGGGIWLNTQRPEWNDANNALAGWGLSVVTVCHMRRYADFLRTLFDDGLPFASLDLSAPVAAFMGEISEILPDAAHPVESDAVRFRLMERLGRSCQRHRDTVYQKENPDTTAVAAGDIRAFLALAIAAIDATLAANRREDGMFHSYNLLEISGETAAVRHLDLMLEGQVAVLGSGLLDASAAIRLLDAMRASRLYREDQNSYLLYPDREVGCYLERNRLPRDWRPRAPLTAAITDSGNRGLLRVDEDGHTRFHPDLANVRNLGDLLDRLAGDPVWTNAVAAERAEILGLWEEVFRHRSFTGRSGAMFAFEGLGSIYWHMIAKLLLAVQETHSAAVQIDPASPQTERLARCYHDVRDGIGYRKDAATYGAFPTDPYSHTPAHGGAQQPGMTGQVKEEILTRMGELGVRIEDGVVVFDPHLLERGEFLTQPHGFETIDLAGNANTLELAADSLAFTLFQVPVIYQIGRVDSIVLHRPDGTSGCFEGNRLPAAASLELFSRGGGIRSLAVTLAKSRFPSPATNP
jgi:hypothetical protein